MSRAAALTSAKVLPQRRTDESLRQISGQVEPSIALFENQGGGDVDLLVGNERGAVITDEG